MYQFQLSEKFLNRSEQEIFKYYLDSHQLDSKIWTVFACLFQSGTKHTKPLLLKVYQDTELIGAAIIIKCQRYGRSLFDNQILSTVINKLKIPFYLWIKFGCCMDMMSNPGFVKNPENALDIFSAMASFLKNQSILCIVNDYTQHSEIYEDSMILPALPHAIIELSNIRDIQAYTQNFKNLKRKKRVFHKKGGEFTILERQLNDKQIISLKKCFLSTSEKSVFYLPYQDLYLNAAIKSSSTPLKQVFYFIATLHGKFIGYQAAIKTGNQLNALHGTFDRNLKSTFHAYDLLFVQMTDFALQNEIKNIDFGAVLNLTKQKMVNRTIDMSYFIYSRYPFIQKLFRFFLKKTKIQNDQQLKFRNQIHP